MLHTTLVISLNVVLYNFQTLQLLQPNLEISYYRHHLFLKMQNNVYFIS